MRRVSSVKVWGFACIYGKNGRIALDTSLAGRGYCVGGRRGENNWKKNVQNKNAGGKAERVSVRFSFIYYYFYSLHSVHPSITRGTYVHIFVYDNMYVFSLCTYIYIYIVLSYITRPITRQTRWRYIYMREWLCCNGFLGFSALFFSFPLIVFTHNTGFYHYYYYIRQRWLL